MPLIPILGRQRLVALHGFETTQGYLVSSMIGSKAIEKTVSEKKKDKVHVETF